MIRSFRVRLTVWYVGCFAALFALLTAGLYGVLSRALTSRLDESLLSQAATASALFQDEMGETQNDPVKSATEAVSNMRLRAGKAAVLDGARVLAASGPFDAAGAVRLAAGARLSAGGRLSAGARESAYSIPGARAAVYRFNFNGRVYVAVAAEPLDAIEADLAAIRRAMLLAFPLILAIAGAGGYWFATRGMAPLDAMTAQARRITGSNLDARLRIGDAAEELTALAESFNELLGRLDQSFDNMRRFVADASHELRTPVAVIRGEADVTLAKERTAAEYKESLAIVLDESRRLSRLVDDLLNLARADAGRVTLQAQEFYWNDLLSECCRSVQSLAVARQIELECRCASDTPFWGDEELLRRMTLNLLDNAIRYTPQGGKVLAELEAHADGVRIRISDTGIGIGVDAAAHVFERFFRADKARSRDNGGFGLGLAIVKWIAESHRGAVELASRPGAGSTFTVTLPR
jgi:two-component system OmpR family sensor kinase